MALETPQNCDGCARVPAAKQLDRQPLEVEPQQEGRQDGLRKAWLKQT